MFCNVSGNSQKIKKKLRKKNGFDHMQWKGASRTKEVRISAEPRKIESNREKKIMELFILPKGSVHDGRGIGQSNNMSRTEKKNAQHFFFSCCCCSTVHVFFRLQPFLCFVERCVQSCFHMFQCAPEQNESKKKQRTTIHSQSN